MTKTCSMCKESKPLSMFADRSNHTAYNTTDRAKKAYEDRCRPCKAEYARAWRKLHPGYNGTGKLLTIPKEDRFLMSAINQRVHQARLRTRKYNQPAMNIDGAYLYQLFKQQEGRCALTGALMKVEKRAVTCLSLDQKVAGLGYVLGNVQWVAWAANRAKGDMDTDVFIDMCQQVLDYQKVQRLSNGSES